MTSENSTVLVTGATGFTGWHAAKRLRASGHRVRALVRDLEKGRQHLGPLGIADEDLIVGDMTDAEAVERALEPCTSAIHTAAAVSVAHGTSGDVFAANVEGTRLVIGGACKRGLDAVVFVSSLTAILDPRSPEATQSNSPLVDAATRYGRSKAESDRFVRGLQEEGQNVSIVYPSAIIGPDDPGRSESMSAFRGFLRFMIDSEGGTQFVDARDLAALFELIVVQRRRDRFVAAGNYFTWRDLRSHIADVTGAHITAIRAPGSLLRGSGLVADLIGRVTGREFMITREAMEVATRWRCVADSPGVAELGVRWRDPNETLRDVYRFFLERGAIPAASAPRLTETPMTRTSNP